jgi:hypothetical protein
MLVIIEGMDGTGKTTLVQQLAHRLEVKPRKFVGSLGPSDDYRVVLVNLTISEITELEIASAEGRSIKRLHDRFPLISEAVYGPILRGHNCFGGPYYPLRRRLLALKTVIIYCRPDRDVIQANVQQAPQMSGVLGHFGELLDAYDKLFVELTESPVNSYITVFDYTRDEVRELIHKIRGFYNCG